MIELKNISYIVDEHGDKNKILDNVSCVFYDKCLTAITGQNGSGKSTLTKIIMGILKPTSGKVLLDGKDITNMGVDDRARLGINYAFQQPVLFRGLTVKDLIDVATGVENSVPKACEILSRVGLCAKEYIDRDFDKTLSGGEQKRIELALSLAKQGNHMIFDEPEAGIDLWSFEKLANIFNKTKCNIVVSHQEQLIQKADYILVLNAGKVQQFDKKSKVFGVLKKQSCAKIGGSDENR